MKQATVFKYEAFTDIPDLGNPAGIVFNGDDYSDEEMQMIAEMAGYNETSFLCKSGEADLRIRYFTPGHEMNLCGHATVASLYALIEKGRLQADQTYQIETKAGILPAKPLNETAGYTSRSNRHPAISAVYGRQRKACGLARDYG